MPAILKIGSQYFEMTESSIIKEINFFLFENKTFEVAIKLSDSAQSSSLLEVLQQNGLSATQRGACDITFYIRDIEPFNAQDIYSVLSDFSNQFGNNTTIDRKVLTILTTRGQNLQKYNFFSGNSKLTGKYNFLDKTTDPLVMSMLIARFREILSRLSSDKINVAFSIKEITNADKLKDINIEIPAEYCCSITHDIMTDPVYIPGDPSDTRFERSVITTWLAICKHTHPLTYATISKEVIPELDERLRDEINAFVADAIANNQTYSKGPK